MNKLMNQTFKWLTRFDGKIVGRKNTKIIEQLGLSGIDNCFDLFDISNPISLLNQIDESSLYETTRYVYFDGQPLSFHIILEKNNDELTFTVSAETETTNLIPFALEEFLDFDYQIVIIRGGDGSFKYVSKVVEKLLGFTRELLYGLTLHQFEALVDNDCLKELFSVDGGSSKDEQVKIISNEGQTFYFEISKGPRIIQGQRLQCIFGKDISGELRMEEKVESLERLSAIGKVAGNIAHDFNNLLSVILGHTGLAKRQADLPSSLLKSITVIEDAATRSSQLTRQLLDYSKALKRHTEVFQINSALYSMKPLLKQLSTKRVSLKLLLGDEDLLVEMTKSQLDQIIINLVVNAKDAIVGKGLIEISLSQIEISASKYCLITCKDSGQGIAKDKIKRIFTPFYSTKGTKGHGLGLAGVKEIVEKNNGLINVESKLGEGTIFQVYLPIAESKPEKVLENESRGYSLN